MWSVAFSPDGNLLASSSADTIIRVWDVETGEASSMEAGYEVTEASLKALGNIPQYLQENLAWLKGERFQEKNEFINAIGRDLLTGNIQETVLWHTRVGHHGEISHVAFSLDSRRLASCSSDSTVRLWDVETGVEVARFTDHSGTVRSVAFSPDGSLLASGSFDRSVRLWDVRQNVSAGVFASDSSIHCVAFSPDGRYLAAGSEDRKIHLWDIPSRMELALLEGHSSSVLSVTFSPDGKYLASGSYDNSVRVWDVQRGAQIFPTAGHTSAVLSVAFSPDGRMIASGSSDNSICLWDAASGIKLAVVNGHASAVNGVAFSRDGKLLASGSADKRIRRMSFVAHLFEGDQRNLWDFIIDPRTADNTALAAELYKTSDHLLAYRLVELDLVGDAAEIAQASTDYFGAISPEERARRFEFRDENLTYYERQNPGYPEREGDEIVLIPDNRQSAVAVILLKQEAALPFGIEFEYSIYDDDGGNDYSQRYNSGDGLVFMFLKNLKSYETQVLPDGGGRGFIQDGTGYGVHFKIYDEREIYLEDPDGNILGSSLYYNRRDRLPDIYTHREWRKVRIWVTATSVTVNYADQDIFTWDGQLTTSFKGIGFGAATGGADAEHKIRNVKISFQ